MTDKVFLENELKERIPEFQKDNEFLDEYLEAVGLFLDEIKQKIESISYNKDYEKSSIGNLERAFGQEGIKFPISLDEDVLRIVVRDIATIVAKKGTKQTLEWIFKVIDLGVDIKEAWMLNPTEFIPPERIDNTTFLYGREVIYDTGVYFDGEDVFGETYNKIPIIGEDYLANAKRGRHPVMKLDTTTPRSYRTDIDMFSNTPIASSPLAGSSDWAEEEGSWVSKKLREDYEVIEEIGKTPYIFLNIDINAYLDFGNRINIFDDSGLDEVVVDFFNQVRPANVAIVFVITIPDFEDVLDLPEEDYQMNVEYPILTDGMWQLETAINHYRFGEYFDTVFLQGIASEDAEGYETSLNMFGNNAYGNEIYGGSLNDDPPEEWYLTGLSNNHRYIKNREEFEPVPQNTYIMNMKHDNSVRYLPIRDNTYMEITPTITTGSFTIEQTTDNRILVREGDASWTTLYTYDPNDTSVDFVFVGDVTTLRLVESVDFEGTVSFDVKYYSMLHPTLFSQKFMTSFERDTEAKMVNEEGVLALVENNEPKRFFFDDGEYAGIQVDAESTNLCRKSEEFDGIPWIRDLSEVEKSGIQTFLDGSNMWFVRRTSQASQISGIYQNIPIGDGEENETYVVSVFGKKGTANKISFLVQQDTFGTIVSFDPSTETFSTSTTSTEFTTQSMFFEKRDDEIYKLIFKFKLETSLNLRVTLLSDADTFDMYNYTFFKACQVQKQNYTSYIKTGINTRGESADVIEVPSVHENLHDNVAIVMDVQTLNDHGYLFVLEDGTEQIEGKIEDGSIYINGELLGNVLYFEDWKQNRINLVVQYQGSTLKAWMMDQGGNSNSLISTRVPFSNEVKLHIGSDINRTKQLSGIVYNLYFSTDDYDTIINQHLDRYLQSYRNYYNGINYL